LHARNAPFGSSNDEVRGAVNVESLERIRKPRVLSLEGRGQETVGDRRVPLVVERHGCDARRIASEIVLKVIV
jgi:hypothetical protein